MFQKTLFVIICVTLNSCATILTKSKYDIQVTSNNLPAQIEINDSIYNLPVKLQVKRSKNDLPIKLIKDSTNKDFILKSSLNPTFIFANLLWTEICPVAYLIDLTNQKRFYYGKNVIINSQDTGRILEPLMFKKIHAYFDKKYPTSKNQFYLKIGMPWINNFYLQPDHEHDKFNTGFWGVSIDLDYFYSDTRFLMYNLSFASDFFLPVPAAVDIYGEYEFMKTLYSSFTVNYKFRRVNLGYGLNISRNSWQISYNPGQDIPPPSREPVTKTSMSLGITMNGYYQIGKHFFIGLIYRPTFLRLDPKIELKYEHLISMDFGWKIKI